MTFRRSCQTPPAPTGAATGGAIRAAWFVSAVLLTAAAVDAQGPADLPPASAAPVSTDQEPERSTGLPSRIKWTFNLDAGWGNAGFANSLYDNPKEPGVDEDLSDQWFEGYVRPALSAVQGPLHERDLRQGQRGR